jgi:hypothetical protein
MMEWQRRLRSLTQSRLLHGYYLLHRISCSVSVLLYLMPEHPGWVALSKGLILLLVHKVHVPYHNIVTSGYISLGVIEGCISRHEVLGQYSVAEK